MSPFDSPFEAMNELEKSVIQAVQDGLAEAVKSRLTQGYHNGPLALLVDSVVKSREDKLKTMIEGAVDGALEGDFGKDLEEAITHKLARVLTSKLEGEIEKRANDLRSSPEFRAKLTLAIERAVKQSASKP